MSLTKLSTKLLEMAEDFYLWAHFWIKLDSNNFIPPDDYDFKRKIRYNRGHAVNAQKQLTHNPMHGGCTEDTKIFQLFNRD